jgi:HD-like signal output (HDOD) protein
MLEEIARGMSSDVVFPTSFATLTRLHHALEDPAIGLAQIGVLILSDPLVCARVLALANSAAYNPSGNPIQNLQKAVERLGLQNVRMVALAVASRQMLLARDAAFRGLGDRIWAHSLQTASTAYVLARRHSRVPPDEALLAGLIHNIGAFYILYCGAQYKALVTDPALMLDLLAEWHESVGHTLAFALGLPPTLADAILNQDQPHDWPEPILTLSDVVYVANQLAGGAAVWQQRPLELPAAQAQLRLSLIDRLGDEIDAHHHTLTAALA